MAAAFTLQEVLLDMGEKQQWQNLLAEEYLFSMPPPSATALCPNLRSPAFAPTDVAELAAAAAPSVMMLGQGPLSLLQAERVERVTADLAEHQLGAGRMNDWHHETRRPGNVTLLRGLKKSGSKGQWRLGGL